MTRSTAIKAKSAGYEKLHKAILSRPNATSPRTRRSTHRNERSSSKFVNPTNLPPYISVTETMRILHVGRLTVSELVEDGDLGTVYDLRSNGATRACLRIPAQAVKEYLRSRRGKSKAKAYVRSRF